MLKQLPALWEAFAPRTARSGDQPQASPDGTVPGRSKVQGQGLGSSGREAWWVTRVALKGNVLEGYCPSPRSGMGADGQPGTQSSEGVESW